MALREPLLKLVKRKMSNTIIRPKTIHHGCLNFFLLNPLLQKLRVYIGTKSTPKIRTGDKMSIGHNNHSMLIYSVMKILHKFRQMAFIPA